MDSLAQLQVASRFSLWMWAIYWPGAGLMLLAGGMTDPASLVVVAGSFLGFVLLAASGGVPASASRDMRSFLLERPLYVIAGAFLLALVASFFDPLQNLGLAIFSSLFLAGVLLTGKCAFEHGRSTGGVFDSKADQVLLAVLLGAVSAGVIFLDAVLPLLGLGTTPAVQTSVVSMNLVSLLYPPLLLLAMRPFREPLRNPFRRRRSTPTEVEEAPEKTPLQT